jgi:hypothetical protein
MLTPFPKAKVKRARVNVKEDLRPLQPLYLPLICKSVSRLYLLFPFFFLLLPSSGWAYTRHLDELFTNPLMLDEVQR